MRLMGLDWVGTTELRCADRDIWRGRSAELQRGAREKEQTSRERGLRYEAAAVSRRKSGSMHICEAELCTVVS